MPGGPGVATGSELATVLVVDDEPATRELLTTYLQGVPCTVQHARDGAGTLAAVAAASPDLVLLDVVLPDMDGYDVLQRLRADPRTATIPIVLITGRTDQTERLRALEAGADDFLIKPVDCAELLARAQTLLHLKRLRDAHAAEAVRQSEAARADERSRLEQQLRQAQKMEAVGRLAGGIAHDFNNLLTAINGYAEMLLLELPPGDPRRLYVEEISRAGERGARLTQQLLLLSRKQPPAAEVLDLNAVVSEIERLLRRLIGEDIQLLLRLAPDLGRIYADRGHIQQVLLNLAVNARDAMPGGGKLVFETANAKLATPAVYLNGTAPPGDYVMLAVGDTGCGMDADTLGHIFEPFFTTKEAGKGTGLGLATVYSIVQQSRGHIWVESEPGRGTTFRLYFPRVPDSAPGGEGPSAPAGADTGTETVLVVEDDDQVRRLMVTTLEARGYTVLQARRGDDALQLATLHGRPLDALVTDVVLPGLGGREVAQRLRVRYPALRVLYVSGYADRAAIKRGVFEVDSSLLEKPFTPIALAHQLRQLLDAPALAPPPAG